MVKKRKQEEVAVAVAVEVEMDVNWVWRVVMHNPGRLAEGKSRPPSSTNGTFYTV